jgi:hypothetical protein
MPAPEAVLRAVASALDAGVTDPEQFNKRVIEHVRGADGATNEFLGVFPIDQHAPPNAHTQLMNIIAPCKRGAWAIAQYEPAGLIGYRYRMVMAAGDGTVCTFVSAKTYAHPPKYDDAWSLMVQYEAFAEHCTEERRRSAAQAAELIQRAGLTTKSTMRLQRSGAAQPFSKASVVGLTDDGMVVAELTLPGSAKRRQHALRPAQLLAAAGITSSKRGDK